MINRPIASFVGLFGYISNATIRNLGVEADKMLGGLYGITGGKSVGGLIGRAESSIIENCYTVGGVKGSTVSGVRSAVGGLVGEVGEHSLIRNCYSTCSVSGGNYIGGLAGVNMGNIQTSYASGTITATESFVGG